MKKTGSFLGGVLLLALCAPAHPQDVPGADLLKAEEKFRMKETGGKETGKETGKKAAAAGAAVGGKQAVPDEEKKILREAEKRLKEHEAALEKEFARDKEKIKGYLTQLRSPRSLLRSRALYAIYGAYTKGVISKRTAIRIFLDAGKDTFPVVSTTAFTKLRAVTGETMGNDLAQWKTWWEDQEKKRIAALKEKFKEAARKEAKGGKAEERKAGTGEAPEAPAAESAEEKAKRLEEEGKKKLIKEHDAALGYLDRIFLKNGRELTCYIVREEKNKKGDVVTYIVKFKGALGYMEIPASEVEGKPQYDIDKEKRTLLVPVPLEEEKKP